MEQAFVRRCLGAVSLLALLAACGQSLPDIKVDEFLADRALLDEYIEKCGNDPGGVGQQPTCINAVKARRHRRLDDARKAAGGDQ